MAFNPAKSVTPPAPQVEVWTIDLPALTPFIATFKAALSPEERARVDAFKHAAARDAFIVARGALRHLLAARLSVAPATVPLQIATHGKPVLAHAGHDSLHFNLSHSGNLALVAIGTGAEVGVDVEQLRPVPDAAQLAKRFFTPTEATALSRLPEEERTTAFFRLWTRKEALLKATGQGIAHGLGRFEVSCEAGCELTAVDGEPAKATEWTLQSWSPLEGYLAAVAVPQPNARFAFRAFAFSPP